MVTTTERRCLRENYLKILSGEYILKISGLFLSLRSVFRILLRWKMFDFWDLENTFSNDFCKILFVTANRIVVYWTKKCHVTVGYIASDIAVYLR